MSKFTDALAKEIFSGKERTYAILDGASVPGLLEKFYEFQPEGDCLYVGKIEPDVAEMAPYLVVVEPKSPFAEWLLGGWGAHWGIFASIPGTLIEARRHLRRYLTVIDPEGKQMLFRYYDPRVFRVYLPTCNEEELGYIFGPVQSFVLEGEEPSQVLRFSIDGGKLKQEIKEVKEK